jgi:hypothetical protein
MMETSLPAPMDDEIDLADVFAALRRRWRWPVAGLLAGCLFGGVVVSVTPQRAKLQFILNLNQGPQRRTPAVVDPSPGMNAFSVPQNQAPLVSPSETKFELESLNRVIEMQPFSNRLDFESYKSGKVSDDNIVIASLDVSRAQVDWGRRFLQVLSRRYQQKIDAIISSSSSSVEPGRPGWLSLGEQPFLLPVKIGSTLTLAGLAGLVFGCAGALLADRRSNRVYSIRKLLMFLGYPVWAKVPAPPWSQSGVDAQFTQLMGVLDPSLRWRVLSIGVEHPCVQPLVQALRRQSSALMLEQQSPLLRHALQADPDGKALGILVVVERGFNSEAALLEARRVLNQMALVQQVGLVVVGECLPAEVQV